MRSAFVIGNRMPNAGFRGILYSSGHASWNQKGSRRLRDGCLLPDAECRIIRR
jgi:hypothetical protein